MYRYLGTVLIFILVLLLNLVIRTKFSIVLNYIKVGYPCSIEHRPSKNKTEMWKTGMHMHMMQQFTPGTIVPVPGYCTGTRTAVLVLYCNCTVRVLYTVHVLK
jgi:hypothetical protein